MSKDGVKRIIERFMSTYGVPNHIPAGRTKEFFAEFEKALTKCDDGLLEKAADQIIATHERGFWPTVGEVGAEVRSIAIALAERRHRQEVFQTQEPYERPDPEARERIQALVSRTVADMRAKAAPRAKFSDQPPVDRIAWEKRMAESARARQIARDGMTGGDDHDE